MNYTILAASTYIVWTVILLVALAAYRTYSNQLNKRKSLKFDPNGADVAPLGQRITRAHANCYESAIFVVGPMLLALATGSAAITNGLAMVVIGARVLQSMVHILSVANIAILLRFVFFLVQVGISVYWLFMIISKFA